MIYPKAMRKDFGVAPNKKEIGHPKFISGFEVATAGH